MMIGMNGSSLRDCRTNQEYSYYMMKPEWIKETIDLMRANHLNPQAWQDFQSCKCGYSYGLGVRTSINSNFPSNSEFGWDGAGGAYVLIDPVLRLGVFYATHIKNHGTYLYQNLHPAIRDAIYEQILS